MSLAGEQSLARSQEVVAGLFEALAALDVDGVLALFASDGRQVMPYGPEGFPERFESRPELERRYRRLLGGCRSVRFPDLVLESMADPTRVLATYRSDIALADGRAYANRYVATFALRGRLVAERVEYFNPIPLQKQLGHVLAEDQGGA